MCEARFEDLTAALQSMRVNDGKNGSAPTSRSCRPGRQPTLRKQTSSQKCYRWVQPVESAGHAVAVSALHAEDNVNDTLHHIELLRVQIVGHLDVTAFRPRDLEGEACRCELNESQTEVAGVGITIVGLDVANPAVIVLKLTLNDEVRVIWPRQIKFVIARTKPGSTRRRTLRRTRVWHGVSWL